MYSPILSIAFRSQFAALALVLLAQAALPRHLPGETAEQLLTRAGVAGGLVVHLGCGDGRLTADLCVSDRYLVHGLDHDDTCVQAARQLIRSRGLYGQVTAECWQGPTLPHADNTVNLLVIEDPKLVEAQEIDRVLRPLGVAMTRRDGAWTRWTKAWPADIDQWTHYLHGPGNNAVARDERVGSPNHLQWEASPKRTRDHDALASLSAMTSSNGRLFYILDEGPTSLIHRPSQWRLIARDAFNGKLLWKRSLDSWVTQLRYFRSGPVQLPRRLVSVGDRVFATLGLNASVAMLDGATGETLKTYEDTSNAEEFIYDEGVLFTVVGDPGEWNRVAPHVDNYWEFYIDRAAEVSKSILAIDTETGNPLWKIQGDHLQHLVPLSLITDGDHVFYMDNQQLHCVDRNTAEESWTAPFATEGLFLRNYTPTLVIYKDVLIVQSLERLAAISTRDGQTLWETKGYAGFASPGDVFVIDDTVWTFPHTKTVHLNPRDVPGEDKQFLGFDLYTGQVKRTLEKNEVWPGGHHHRCYRNKATERFAICGHRGVEFVDLQGEEHVKNWWIRGICQYGILPCNGLLYVPPHPCRCFSQYKFDGFHAFASSRSEAGSDLAEADRLTRGPGYDRSLERQLPEEATPTEDWPTYRHDIRRSGSTSTQVPARPRLAWKTDIGSRLSGAVVAEGKVLVSAVDRHSVHCMDANDGEPLWDFIAGGRVDSPPTIDGGMAIFGCRDGSVYALRLADGQLAWKFQASPRDRRIIVRERLESVWPIHGSVLVNQGIVYLAAGHSSYIDGGIRLIGLDARTGAVVHETQVASEANSQTGALPDVLVSDGVTLSMRHLQFDMSLDSTNDSRRSTLVSTTGLLEDLWAHRLNWTLGSTSQPKSFEANVPFGKLIVFDDRMAYGVQSFYTVLKHTKSMWPETHTGHLHQKYARYTTDQFPIGNRVFAMQQIDSAPKPAKAQRRTAGNPQRTSARRPKWSQTMPLQIRAMVLTDPHLFVAGWEDAVAVDPAEHGVAMDGGSEQAWIWTLDANDGSTISRLRLDADPVFDGMAAAYGRLYLPLQDGTLICLGDAAAP